MSSKASVKVRVGKRILAGSVGGSVTGSNFVMVHVLLDGVWAAWEFAQSTVEDARTNGSILIV